ncbi:hypothetical protein TD95_000756 [Thielaviopsis punctulata]|uniref:Aldehyde dehydrogenase domain-containing protein n=1 Tax=Thielaviopsis punctulata TaxID=72032 RepID=A0A0F4Z9J9_9PEZI|nr:hypothetical protein TD95_000756 [Thielaviopsis punctulata]
MARLQGFLPSAWALSNRSVAFRTAVACRPAAALFPRYGCIARAFSCAHGNKHVTAAASSSYAWPVYHALQQRWSSTTVHQDLEVKLTAPNGISWVQPLGLFINNEFVRSSNAQKFETLNPTTESAICSVYAATEKDVNAAVHAAKTAFKAPSWRSLSGTQRSEFMFKLADLIDQHAETLATIETLDNGKPLSASRGFDVPHFSEVIRYYAGYADKIHGQTMDVGPNKLAYTIKEPLGVCAQIIPWNYPLDMAAWKLGPALACGNTVVLKLAEQTPLSMLYVATLIREAGFPPGVVNIINGTGRETGPALVQHADVAKVAFTGSTATGREIMRMAAGTLKNITLETGGKSPLIVFEDADIAQAAHWAHEGVMSNQGQMCTATSRLLVHKGVMDEFLEGFMKTVRQISVVGDPFASSTFQGPQVTRAQYERVLEYVSIARSEGATVYAGGTPVDALQSGKGFFIEPTIFTDITPDMRVYREEIFGPCVVVVPFSSEEEAIALANGSSYGLGAAVFTQNISRGHRVAREIEAGMVWINSSNDSDFRVPFGGVKQSGIGRELGEAGLQGYSQIKAVHVNLGS